MAALLERLDLLGLITRAAAVIRESDDADEHAGILEELEIAARELAGDELEARDAGRFTYRGSVYFANRGAGDCERLETTITIEAPNAATADAIVRRYGLDSVRRQKGGR